MRLTEEQVREAVKAPAKGEMLRRARSLQRRVRFHSEPATRFEDNPEPASEFLDWVSGLLPGDKFATFKSLFRFPLEVPPFVGSIYRDLERVFDSRNSLFEYQFTDSSIREDWDRFRTLSLGEPEVWRDKGLSMVRNSPNSVLVVDMSDRTASGRPEPYFYWLQVDDIVDYMTTADARGMEYVVFRQPGGRYAVADGYSIRVFDKDPEEDNIGRLVREFRHGLGYCPAMFFWGVSASTDAPDLKANPITEVLSALDKLLLFSVSKDQFDMYASYPIYSAYEADCDYENNETHEYCDGGYLRNTDTQQWLFEGRGLKPCPCCGQKRIVGPGSFVEVPVPNSLDGSVDLSDPIHITTVDKDALKYNVSEIERKKDEIRSIVAGYGSGDVTRKEAVNETQAHANFEDKTDVLKAFARNFERAQKFVDDTVCRLRYGSDFIGSSINWGTEFYLYTAEELWGKYEAAKRGGASESVLDEIMDQIVDVENKDNQASLKRMRVLKQLEPFKNKTIEQVESLYSAGLCSKTDVVLKVNFIDYVEEFERENGTVLVFGSEMPNPGDKIKAIKQILRRYAARDAANTEGPAGPGDRGEAAGAGGGSGAPEEEKE